MDYLVVTDWSKEDFELALNDVAKQGYAMTAYVFNSGSGSSICHSAVMERAAGVAKGTTLSSSISHALSLAELQEMNGTPVWLEKLRFDVDLADTGWAMADGLHVLTYRDGIPVSWCCEVKVFGDADAKYPNVLDYGVTRVAYRKSRDRGNA